MQPREYRDTAQWLSWGEWFKCILENSWAATSLSAFHPGQRGQRGRLPGPRIAFFGVIRSVLRPRSSGPPSERTRLETRSDFLRGETGWKQLSSLMWELMWEKGRKDPRCVLYSCIPNPKGPTQTQSSVPRDGESATYTQKDTESAKLNCSTFWEMVASLCLTKWSHFHIRHLEETLIQSAFWAEIFFVTVAVSVTLWWIHLLKLDSHFVEMMKMRRDTKCL